MDVAKLTVGVNGEDIRNGAVRPEQFSMAVVRAISRLCFQTYNSQPAESYFIITS